MIEILLVKIEGKSPHFTKIDNRASNDYIWLLKMAKNKRTTDVKRVTCRVLVKGPAVG